MDGAKVEDVAGAFKQALRGVVSTVNVVTASDGGRHHGMTVTAVTSLSMDPPALTMCLNRSSLLHDIMRQARYFCVNVLSDRQQDVSAAFSGGVAPEERFGCGNWAYTDGGLGYLLDAQASIFCEKAAAVPYGTHTLFIGEVQKVAFSEDQTPLLYKNAGYCAPAPRALPASTPGLKENRDGFRACDASYSARSR